MGSNLSRWSRKRRKKSKKVAILIGIDPGEHTGFAVWDTRLGEFRQVCTLSLWEALEEVKRWWFACTMAPVSVSFAVIFEDARQRTWFAPERNNSEYRGKLMGAGAAKRDAKIWEEFLEEHHIDYWALKPAAGRTKWNADYWAQVTGWKGRTSEHARDAALLVFGRK